MVWMPSNSTVATLAWMWIHHSLRFDFCTCLDINICTRFYQKKIKHMYEVDGEEWIQKQKVATKLLIGLSLVGIPFFWAFGANPNLRRGSRIEHRRKLCSVHTAYNSSIWMDSHLIKKKKKVYWVFGSRLAFVIFTVANRRLAVLFCHC